MDHNDEHDEDDLPIVSAPVSTLRRKTPNDIDEQENTENDQSSKFVENWHNLYETSMHSLQSDDEDQRSITQKPFYFDRQASFKKPPEERPYSPMDQSQLDSNATKSKWQIRLPQLLSGTVGPDRQKRDITRRHTTNIVFQPSNSQNQEFNTYYSTQTPNGEQSISPLVKQLKQKFDRIIANNTITDGTRTPPKFQSGGPKLHRAASLTSRGSTANTGGRSILKPRPMLPIRPSPEMSHLKLRTANSGSLNNSQSITNGRPHRGKTGPPVSYPKHFYPPPSTTSVVKQLIGGGATLIYDSVTQQTASNTDRSAFKHYKNIEKTTQDLKNTNTVLTGRQQTSDSSYNDYPTASKSNRNMKDESTEDLSEENIYEPVLSRQPSNISSEREPIPDHPISTNDNEPSNYYPVYDLD